MGLFFKNHVKISVIIKFCLPRLYECELLLLLVRLNSLIKAEFIMGLFFKNHVKISVIIKLL